MSSYECEYSDRIVFFVMLGFYVGFSLLMMSLVALCKKKKDDDVFWKERMHYTEYMGRWPVLNFILTALLIIAASSLSILSPCLDVKPFTIDKETENYIKSQNTETDNYDMMMAAIEDTNANGGWRYRRRLKEEVSSIGDSDADTVAGADASNGNSLGVDVFASALGLSPSPVALSPSSLLTPSLLVPSLYHGNNPFPNIIMDEPRLVDVDYYDGVMSREISQHPMMGYVDAYDATAAYDVAAYDATAHISSNYGRQPGATRQLAKSFQTSLTFVYIKDTLPSNIFNDADISSIRKFENKIFALKDYEKMCRKTSYYTENEADTGCAQQAAAVTNWFYDTSSTGVDSLLNIDDTLKSMAQAGVVSFMDLYFSLDFRQSNLTRTTLYFQAPSRDAYNTWLTDVVVPLARESSTKEYRVLYYDGGYLFDWEVDEAVFNDAKWSGLAFIAVFLFVWLHTRSFIVSFFGMLGVTASIPVSLWIYKDIIEIDHVSILNFLSLFVIMGIGADDMFVFYDTYEVVAHEDARLLDDIPARLARTFRRATSAMLVTSVSTAASFFANIVSALPVIKEFGIFMGLVVTVNFAIIVIFFPNLVIIADKLCSGCRKKGRRVIIKRASYESDVRLNESLNEEDRNGFASAMPVAQLSTGLLSTQNSDFNESNQDINAIPTATAAPLTTAKRLSKKQAAEARDLSAKPGTVARGPDGKPMLAQMREKRDKGVESVKQMLGFSSSGDNEGAHYDRESFAISSKDGWGVVERFFHNTWAPVIFSCRFFIFIATIAFVVFCAIFSAILLVPADKPPSFFSTSHNIGMLEIVNQEYVASSSMNIDAADAVAWGLIDNLPSGGGGGGGSGSGNTENYCPVVDGNLCSGQGSCNSLTGACICFSGYSGYDCSNVEGSGSLVIGNLVLSRDEWFIDDYDRQKVVSSFTVRNTGQTKLNWYFIEGESEFGTFLSQDDSGIPAWLNISDYSGSVSASATKTLTLVFDPTMMDCDITTCIDQYEWIFTHTGENGLDVPLRARLGRLTPSPTQTPTPAPTSAPTTLAPTGTPTLTPTKAPTTSPTKAPTVSPTASPTLPICKNGIQDDGETDVDCGGDICPGCSVGLVCLDDADCSSFNCVGGSCGLAPTASPTIAPTIAPTPSPPPTTSPTVAPTIAPTKSPTIAPTTSPTQAPTTISCDNGVKDGLETSLDCGGPDCNGCDIGQACLVDSDCESLNCWAEEGVCRGAPTASPTQAPTLSPTLAPTQAPTPPTPSPTQAPTTSPTPAPSIAPTTSPTKAPTLSPTSRPTIAPTTPAPTLSQCDDNSLNGLETQTDCGGPVCPGCPIGGTCLLDRDCATNTCDGDTSQCIGAPTMAPTIAPTQAPTSRPTIAPTLAPTTSPTIAPTKSPTIAPTQSPTTKAPTASPTTLAPTKLPTIAPTLSPTLAPTLFPTVTPTAAPTPVNCNSAYCNNHGRCVEETKCQCFPGFVGKKCEYIETKEKTNHVALDIYWGVKGIDRDAIDENFPTGKPIFDPSFNMSSEAQLYLKTSCDIFRNASATLNTFPDGRDWMCLWEVFDQWLVSSTGKGLPLDPVELVDKLAGKVGESVPSGFFSTGYVYISGKKRASYVFKPYIGLDMVKREIKWTRIAVDTTIEDTMDAVKAEKLYDAWNDFLSEVRKEAPDDLGQIKMASFLWVRIATELSLIRSTITAWGISNVSAFVAILLFTQSLYIALMTTLCIFFIVVCLVWFMVVVMRWPLGAMEALSVTIFVGMACDYCLHIAHAFMHSEAPSSHLKVRQALTTVGNSVVGAAFTTIGSCVFLMFCVIVFFKKMGIIIIVNTLGSLFFALVFFPAMLSVGDKAKKSVSNVSGNVFNSSFSSRDSDQPNPSNFKQVSPDPSPRQEEDEMASSGNVSNVGDVELTEVQRRFDYDDDGGGKGRPVGTSGVNEVV